MTSISRRRTEPHENSNHFPVERVVRAYEKEGDRLISEFVLKDANLLELQLFGEPEQNLMVECYPIARPQADYLQQRFHIQFKLDAFDYFLECNAV